MFPVGQFVVCLLLQLIEKSASSGPDFSDIRFLGNKGYQIPARRLYSKIYGGNGKRYGVHFPGETRNFFVLFLFVAQDAIFERATRPWLQRLKCQRWGGKDFCMFYWMIGHCINIHSSRFISELFSPPNSPEVPVHGISVNSVKLCQARPDHACLWPTDSNYHIWPTFTNYQFIPIH